MNVNKKQTPLNEETLSKLTPYVKRELLDFIENIPFVQNLINPNRNTVAKADKLTNGKVVVNLTNPHILENMDYFRQAAIHYKEHGCYTKAFKSKHPNSEYRKFWDEEGRKCRDGLVREDGEWITGYNYFYWNYAPILLTQDKEYEEKDVKEIINNLE
jgi:hypothetical protein